MAIVAQYPDSTKTSLEQRLAARARERWPQITRLQIRHRGAFSYVEATLTGATALKLCRLRYVGSAHQWQFAIYRASHDDYDESIFPTGLPVGTCQDALDTACGLYLNDPRLFQDHDVSPRMVNGRSMERPAHRVASVTSMRPVMRSAPIARLRRAAMTLGPFRVLTLDLSSWYKVSRSQ